MGELSENPAPRRRWRRRWLIVAFVLVLVSMVAWWNWPRGDARFVGTWTMQGFDNKGGQHSATITLRRNGSGVTVYAGQQPLRFGWSVVNERLIIGPWPAPNEEEYEIVEWSESRIELRGKKLAEERQVTMTRILE
jgi:hypothetical protein